MYAGSSRDPHPTLRGLVETYWGRTERTAGPVRRLEVPYPAVIVSLSFGPTLRANGEQLSSFVAGLHEHGVTTEHDGLADGVQIALSPLGARALFGVPMSELTSRVVPLDCVWPAGEQLTERLQGERDWTARFDVLDRALAARFAAARAPGAEVRWAWRSLYDSNGSVRVGELTRELEWSRKRLATVFRDWVGLTPKRAGRVLRFSRAARLLRAASPLAATAYACGYYDQAHLNRDFRALAGLTPTEFLGRLSPDDPGVAA